MDLNVCSRRVHDGFATIRSRPRSRPRALYRSDSEELLKETGGPYTLPIVSANVPLASEKIHQVPRWSDMGKNKLLENYGTLRRSNKKSHEISNNSKLDKKIILNTFTSQKETKDNKNTSQDNVYDSVPMKINSNTTKSVLNSSTDENNVQNELDKILDNRENYYDTVTVENLNSIKKSRELTNEIKSRQPIYDIPNVSRLKDKINHEQTNLITDGNYVPSGDLYRTTAKYIEDINKNLAEIDKSYEELGYASNTNSGYGVINRAVKSDYQGHEESLYRIRRKRNMAPMLPITSDFDENNDDKGINQNTLELRNTICKIRPNSFGKLPPKLLPRSSSIENTSRHSTGSTSTTNSSTKSTESLYAISESLTNLQHNKMTSRSPKNFKRKILPTKLFDMDSSSTNVLRRNRSSGVDITTTLHTQDQSTTVVTLNSGGRILDPGIESDDETRHVSRPRVSGTLRRSRSRVDDIKKKIPNGLSRINASENDFSDRQYDTLPCRKTKVSTAPRPLHKSSEDVLDGERISPRLERSCTSTIDIRNNDIKNENNFSPTDFYPLYLMDATDVLLQSQQFRNIQPDTVSHSSVSPQHIDRHMNNKFSSLSRTRHNSLESNDDNSFVYLTNAVGNNGFATLPRRRNATSSSSPSSEAGLSGKRHSGTVLEPLYEHAVSNPVKPRGNESTVIPWWELATRKYRHRSCPTLQAHVVSAFEQSLSNMTQRLQQLTATAEKKDSELHELRETIERLRKQSAEATLNTRTSPNGRRHTLGDSDSGTIGCTGYSSHQGSSIARQLSADSVTSLNSLSSACSASSHHKKKGWLRSSFSKAFSRSRKNRHGSVSDAEDCKEGAAGELSAPNSPRLPTAVKHDNSNQNHGQKTVNGQQKSPEHENALSGSKSSSALYKKEEDDEDVDELKKQLREKDMVLTDIRLEALSSAHQLESLKDTVIKMRNEMLNLKQNNERLQRLVTSKSLTSSQSSLPSDPERRFSMTEVASTVAALSNGGDHSSTNDHQLEDLSVPEHPPVGTNTRSFCQSTTNEPVIEQDTDGKRINVAVYLGSENNFNFNLISGNNDGIGIGKPPHCIIANVRISNKTTWDSLDSTVRRCFKDYISRVDPVTNLGLGVECVAAYHLGEASRCITDSNHPELLPCGYLIGHVKTIYLVLSGYSWLAVDTLIPRSIVQRLVSLLTEHRRVILCGPSGTGKSYLAGKLAHALVDSDAESKDAAAVATFNVDHKSSKELRQYLTHIAERCDSNAADELPRVIILENLQHAASLGELFSGLLGTRHLSCPAIIGTMSQATCSTTNLQLHHNFRWVLCANHMEPVKGFLGRYLRRKLLEHELRDADGTRNAEIAAVVEWLPRVWLHLNKFLETHSSSDVTIGPRLFLSCPMEVAGSQVWFTDLWNYSVIPYLVEAVREGLTLYGRRTSGNGNTDGAWEDPAQFITSSYPWISTHAVHGGSDALLRLRPEDVGYDVVSSGHPSGVGASSVKSLGSAHSDTEGDPLLNMLMRLQEAANYSSPHSNDSGSVTSLDSSHTRHSEELNTSTSSSRGVESAL